MDWGEFSCLNCSGGNQYAISPFGFYRFMNNSWNKLDHTMIIPNIELWILVTVWVSLYRFRVTETFARSKGTLTQRTMYSHFTSIRRMDMLLSCCRSVDKTNNTHLSLTFMLQTIQHSLGVCGFVFYFAVFYWPNAANHKTDEKYHPNKLMPKCIAMNAFN